MELHRLSILFLGFVVLGAAYGDTFSPHFHDFEKYPWKEFSDREMDFVNYIVLCDSAKEDGDGIEFLYQSGLELHPVYHRGETTNIGILFSSRTRSSKIRAIVELIRDTEHRIVYAYPGDKYDSVGIGSTTVWRIPNDQKPGSYEILACMFTSDSLAKRAESFRIE